jgi:lipopolysaccharide assembly outer membrane protein LptD (OstA)
MKMLHLIFTFILAGVSSLSAFMASDSLLSDSLSLKIAPDSTQKKSVDMEDPVFYKAEDIAMSEDGNIIILQDNAQLTYQNMELKAAYIKMDRLKNTLFAYGKYDSVDAEGNKILGGVPLFTEKGQEPMIGDTIEYNFKTKRGKIAMGKTKMDPGYYKGEKINKVGDSTLLVQNGYFTSCEHIDEPHYYFKSSRMRITMKDKIVAEPITFYIADVPLAWFPFGIFPNKRGRASGIVVPSYGENKKGGRFLRGLGYYWALNDYTDAEFLVDFYDKLGFSYRGSFNYKLRYVLGGNVNAEYLPYDLTTGAKRKRWRFNFRHNHKVNKTLSISGSGTFVSDKTYIRDLSPNAQDRLNQNINSNLTVRKSWPGSRNSLTVNASHNYNLQTERVDYTLPTLSFSRGTTSLWETITGEKLSSNKLWYQNINWSYSGKLLQKGTIVPDDSLDISTDKKGAQHHISLSSTGKLLKYLNITPSVRYREDWTDELVYASYDPESKTIVEKTVKEFGARRTFNTGISAKTTLYGLFEPNIGTLKLIRHKVDPTVSMTFTPDFSEAFYGYFNEVADSNGVTQKIDMWKKSAFGSTPSSQSQRLNISLNNLFQAKFINDEDNESKMDLLQVRFSSGYNFMADSLRWSNLNSYVSTTILGKKINVRMQHSFYKPKANGTGQINQFQIPRLLSLSTSFGVSVDSKMFEEKDETDETPKEKHKKDEFDIADNANLGNYQVYEDRQNHMNEMKNTQIPWSASFNLNYSLDRRNINDSKQRIGGSARANFSLTRNWKIGWNAQLDLVEGEITSQSFNIYRDLHCWEMSIGWQPQYDYYHFKINVKSSMLQDIKITKHPSTSSRYQY